MTARAKPIRCAIYTRVSTDSGLDQEFNSLDAQSLSSRNSQAAYRGDHPRSCHRD
jgi:hypothetical protein